MPWERVFLRGAAPGFRGGGGSRGCDPPKQGSGEVSTRLPPTAEPGGERPGPGKPPRLRGTGALYHALHPPPLSPGGDARGRAPTAGQRQRLGSAHLRGPRPRGGRQPRPLRAAPRPCAPPPPPPPPPRGEAWAEGAPSGPRGEAGGGAERGHRGSGGGAARRGQSGPAGAEPPKPRAEFRAGGRAEAAPGPGRAPRLGRTERGAAVAGGGGGAGAGKREMRPAAARALTGQRRLPQPAQATGLPAVLIVFSFFFLTEEKNLTSRTKATLEPFIFFIEPNGGFQGAGRANLKHDSKEAPSAHVSFRKKNETSPIFLDCTHTSSVSCH
ncbi:translation initiation factor IF-2-like isoform X1 [Aquila chrysaetos chrysaetos]|uniref:translation initiation factor IF-2-like isoform X1 n=1 Tax=Aquila chrysaetos chrysaetos TaxID=223781 RepID=UPI001176FADB|nr:translation initiation factor IF-2-like isoform X1 [Aquila chrysaetos chrysaetos]XP_029874663.1 translation initiation factor IF-2-like isoform X1 [Aquila chrysaetos chrysaetos]